MLFGSSGSYLCGSGGTGRHTILRGWRRKAWGFKSPLPHQPFRINIIDNHATVMLLQSQEGITMNRKVNITKRVKVGNVLRYCPIVESANGRIRPDRVVVGEVLVKGRMEPKQEVHP